MTSMKAIKDAGELQLHREYTNVTLKINYFDGPTIVPGLQGCWEDDGFRTEKSFYPLRSSGHQLLVLIGDHYVRPRPRPQPKYRRGAVLRRKDVGKVHVNGAPTWSKEHGQWLYPYDYGVNAGSEGVALELELS